METPQQSWGDWASSFFKPKEQETDVASSFGTSDGVPGGRRKKTRRGGKRKSRKARRSRK